MTALAFERHLARRQPHTSTITHTEPLPGRDDGNRCERNIKRVATRHKHLRQRYGEVLENAALYARAGVEIPAQLSGALRELTTKLGSTGDQLRRWRTLHYLETGTAYTLEERTAE